MSLSNDNNDDRTSSPGRTRQTNKGDISPEEHQRILELRNHRYGMRQIALRIGRDRKTVRRILQEEGLLDRHPPDHRWYVVRLGIVCCIRC